MKHRDLKALNRETLISLLLRESLLSRVDLARKAQVSPAAVSNIIKECLREGILREASSGPSRGGRRPILLSFIPDKRYVIGLIPGTETEFALADLAGRLIIRKKICGKHSPTPNDLAVYLREHLTDFLKDHALSWQQVVSLGIGIPGIYDPELDRIHKMGQVSGLTEWEGAHVRDIFSREFSCPVLVFDKVVAIAFSEGILRSGDPDIDLVYLHLGRGVGAGLVLGGKIYRGAQGAAGEVGYMVSRSVDQARSRILPQEMPALEKEISLNTVIQKARRHCPAYFESEDKEFGSHELSALARAFREGNSGCRDMIEPVFERVEDLAVNLAAVLNPDRLILGGELMDLFFESLFPRIERRLRNSVLFPPVVEPVSFGKSEEITCTLFFAVDDYFHRLTGGLQGLTLSFLERYNEGLGKYSEKGESTLLPSYGKEL